MGKIASGGRGKEAPYDTEMFRIPSPTKPVVKKLGHVYREALEQPSDPKGFKFLDYMEQVLADYPPSKRVRVKSAIALLKEALHLKANAGGAIKEKIRAVLELLGEEP